MARTPRGPDRGKPDGKPDDKPGKKAGGKPRGKQDGQPAAEPPPQSAPGPAPDPAIGTSSGLVASFALAAAALAVFLLLPQRTFHGFDSDWYTLAVQSYAQNGQNGLRQHVAFLPLVGLVYELIQPRGFGAFHALLVTAALGSAIGVFFLHRAGRLLLAQGADARALAVGVALTPACFYFATAAEIHGVFAAGSGAAWWAFARWRSNPNLARAATVGAACGLAASIHGFGHLLTPMFVAIALTQGKARGSYLAAFVLAHPLVAGAMAIALGGFASDQTDAAVTFLDPWAKTSDLALAPATLWREAFVPFLPWSLLAVLGFLRAQSRPWSAAFVLGTALHAPIVILLLSRQGSQFHEQGGYLLPMAVPAVLASITLLPRPLYWLAALVSAGLTAALVVPRWPRAYKPEFVAAVEQLRTERNFVLLVGPNELEGVRTEIAGPSPSTNKPLLCVEVNRSLESFFGLSRASPQPAPIAPWFDAMIDGLTKGGDSVLVTAEAQRCFDQSPIESVRSLWRDHVPRHYTLEPLQRTGLDGVVLRRR
ncbi:MAG TPA: hypothetical protein VF384_08485 [Planctomycetota bacterium]